MSTNQGITVHPNRVFVKELPVTVDREELKNAFSGLGLRIRTARVVDTNGSTNYGFVTFDTKEEADEVIQMAKSERGILIRGMKACVDRAFSRRSPTNINQFARALQSLPRSLGSSFDSASFARQNSLRQSYNDHYSSSSSQHQQGATSPDQMHYATQSTPYNMVGCYGVQPMYVNSGLPGQQTAQGVGQNGHVPFQHGSLHNETRQPSQWQVMNGHYPYDTAEHANQRYGAMHSSYVQTHHPGPHGTFYLGNPAEGTEAPDMSEWSSQTESAAVHRMEPEAPNGYHHPQNTDLSNQSQTQVYHTQLLHQNTAHRQNMLTTPWIYYTQQHHPAQSPRRESGCSEN